MNIVNKVTLRHLKENKRRTLVTIIGVIISVAMLTAVATIGVSFMDLLKRQTISQTGEWHVQYQDVNAEQLDVIRKNENTKNLVTSKDLGYAYLEDSKNEHKPYLFIKQYSNEGLREFPIELTEGNLPQSENEVVIAEHIADNAKVGYQIGDILALEIGNRVPIAEENSYKLYQTDSLLLNEEGERQEKLSELHTKEYKVVGVMKRPSWEPLWAPGYTMITYLDENQIGATDTVDVSVALKKVNQSIFDATEKFANDIGVSSEKYNFNHELLRYMGVMKNDNMRTTLYSLSAIIIAIIMIGSISLIYNAFAISVSERSRHLGMLSSVGATRKQKLKSVFFEGGVIGLISIPIGVIAGLIGIGITFYFINSAIQGAFGLSETLHVTVTTASIMISVILSLLTIFISTLIPAIRASKISAIDAIRQVVDVKLTGKAVKTSKLVRKIFGIEAEIGLKNLKRNKRKYQATVFSIVISIVLFLSVSFFTHSLKKSLVLSQEGLNYDILMMLNHEGDAQLAQTIISMEEVINHNIMTEVSGLGTWVENDKVADEVKEFEGFYDLLQDGKYQYYINLVALDDESLKNYTKKVGADYEPLRNEFNAIVIDTISYEDARAGKYVETKAIHTKVGEKIELFATDWETGEMIVEDQVTITALTDQFPMGAHSPGIGGLTIVVSQNTLQKLGDGELIKQENPTYLYLTSKDPIKTQQKIEELEDVKHYIHNQYQNRQEEQQLIMLLSVFTYGFIALITAISTANILNTISTSISLRKREFAMLKSVGMTPKGFNKMINYESIFYGMKAVFYGLPISIAAMYLIHRSLMNSFMYSFKLPWLNIIFVIIAVFFIVGISMLYSSAKVKKENIIDALKQENI